MTDGEADMMINALSIIALYPTPIYIYTYVGFFLPERFENAQMPHMLTFLILYLANDIQRAVSD